jgi:peroxiredoxin
VLRSPYLPWTILLAAAGFVLAGWGGGLFSTSQPLSGGTTDRHDDDREHYVTPAQLADAGNRARARSDLPAAVAHDGRHYTWEDLSVGKPVALVFIKSGCPCNVRFEPFYHRLELANRGAVRFFGVMDADPDAARQYVTAQNVPYPVLADPDLRIVGRLGAKNGCYLVLLDPDGGIVGVWPGCSADGMRDAGARMARLAGIDEQPLDVSGMPAALTAGCPFE